MPLSGKRSHRDRRYSAPTGASCALGTSNETEKRREEKSREVKSREERKEHVMQREESTKG